MLNIKNIFFVESEKRGKFREFKEIACYNELQSGNKIAFSGYFQEIKWKKTSFKEKIKRF